MCPGLCNTYYIYIFIIYDCNQLHGSFLFLRIKIHNIYIYIYIYIFIYNDIYYLYYIDLHV